ncbi:hypothetical protein LS684_20965 (plasmid) [Cytobacillus spongiae]|uniref:hypothetical protein n=1 Tax=Cytobacillus spongiae TaxID=2901381 RepID=UPI001F2A5110|nr:hypothetical protein [Cytobacillus spongiae]UII58097.1 hypothetical protein LS684_20965 [Cytobacillus spongiae]
MAPGKRFVLQSRLLGPTNEGGDEVSQHITSTHLDFLDEAIEAFMKNEILETYWDKGTFDLIAMRFGMDRDCVLIYELGEEIANFVQQMEPAPKPRAEIRRFSYSMERKMKYDEETFRESLESQHHQDLTGYILTRTEQLRKELIRHDKDKDIISEFCSEIANYSMVISQKHGKLGGSN